MFCLFYDAKSKKVHSLNGSGRYPANATLEKIRNDLNLGGNEKRSIPMTSALSVTTPGAAAGWVDTVERFGSGKLSLEQILTPAIELGEQGFAVSERSDCFSSGVRVKICYEMHLQIFGKCSSLIRKPKMVLEAPFLVKL
jgi:gamma-glutamyltranspeptidase/glutathione hydrolase